MRAALALLLSLTSSAVLAEASSHPAGTLQIPAEISSAECATQGGTETQINGPECVFMTHDSGKACTDSKQCEGDCIADTETATAGICGGYIDAMGCYAIINNGKAEEWFCRD